MTACPTSCPTRSTWSSGTRSSKKSDGQGFELKKHDLGTQAAGHGVGSGDVNGDGRVDLLTPKGWFEAPADPPHGTWAWHPDWQLGATGIQILARDVDGDGLSDIVYGMGHDYGLFWLHQTKGSGGERTWTKQTIDDSVASVHALMWADIDGDGKANELVTGKRVYAHEIEPGATDGSLVAWYAFDPNSKSWVKHVIFQGEPAKNAPAKGSDRLALKDFPPGTAGTGLQMTAIDIDRDGDLDLVCPGKSGLYLFENLRARNEYGSARPDFDWQSYADGSRGPSGQAYSARFDARSSRSWAASRSAWCLMASRSVGDPVAIAHGTSRSAASSG